MTPEQQAIILRIRRYNWAYALAWEHALQANPDATPEEIHKLAQADACGQVYGD